MPKPDNSKIKASASKLSTYKECPLKGHLKYELGYREEEKYYLNRGSLFHEIAAEILLGRFKRKKEYHKLLDDRFNELKEKDTLLSGGQVSEDDLLELLHKAVDEFIASLKTRGEFKILDYQRTEESPPEKAIELRFDIPIVDLETNEKLDKSNLYGIIDEISFSKEYGFSVRDHKLHSERIYGFVLRSDLQLKCYAYAFYYLWREGFFPEIKTLPNVNLGLNSFLINKAKTKVSYKFLNFTLSEQEIKTIPYLLVKYINFTRSKAIIPNIQPSCLYRCSFHNLCNKFQNGEEISSARKVEVNEHLKDIDGEILL